MHGVKQSSCRNNYEGRMVEQYADSRVPHPKTTLVANCKDFESLKRRKTPINI